MELQLDEYLDLPLQVKLLSGEDVDADALPSYRIYADGAETPIETGSAAKRDDANTVGYYVVRTQLTAAKGYAVETIYHVRVTATAGGGVSGSKTIGMFLVVAADMLREGDLDQIAADTGLLGRGALTVTTPVLASDHLAVFQGADYPDEEGRAIEWVDVDGVLPDLSLATIALRIHARQTGSVLATWPGTWVAGPPNKLRFEPAAAQTGALGLGFKRYGFSIVATQPDGHLVPAVMGDLSVHPVWPH